MSSRPTPTPAANAVTDGMADADMAVASAALTSGDSDMLARYWAARQAGLSFGGKRDYYDVLGYDPSPDPEDYYVAYLRNKGGIAQPIVDLPPETTWRHRPIVQDTGVEGDRESDDPQTPFEVAIEYLFDERRLLHYMTRFDKVVGLGEYGLLYLGFADGEGGDGEDPPDLSEPVEPGSLDEIDPDTDPEDDPIAFFRPVAQANVTDINYDTDLRSPRAGLPVTYDIQFNFGDVERTESVHYTRVIHAAEDLLESEVFGSPRLESALNRLEDLEKVLGGSAEMFWRSADRKFQLDIDPDMGAIDDAEDVADRAEAWIHGLQSMFRTRGVEVNTFEGDDPDPTGIAGEIEKVIAGDTGIPRRILTGSERGELASTQDRATFLGRIGERQIQFAEPMEFRATVDRLIWSGAIPAPQGGDYVVEWPDLFELNEIEIAEIREKNANALSVASGGAPLQVAVVEEVRSEIMGWEAERGSESPVDPAEFDEIADEDEPETDEERDAMDELDEIIDSLPVDAETE